MHPSSQSKNAPIVFFDGVCNLCAWSVQLIIRHEQRPRLMFSSLQSTKALEMLPKYGLDPTQKESLVVWHKDRVYQQSDAALFIARNLRFPYRVPAYFGWIPKSIRDAIYHWIARNRYRWFGKKQECWLPDKSLENRFIA